MFAKGMNDPLMIEGYEKKTSKKGPDGRILLVDENEENIQDILIKAKELYRDDDLRGALV